MKARRVLLLMVPCVSIFVSLYAHITPFNFNIPPAVNAGADTSVTLPINNVVLSGTGNDVDGTITGTAWTKIAGPAGAVISTPSAMQTSVTNLTQGVYQFRLELTDNDGDQSADTVMVTVHATPNQAPVVNAGADQAIILPSNSVNLSGAATDADGSIVSYEWKKLSGPSNFILVAPAAASTTVTGLVQGIYVFRLTVKDNSGALTSDEVQVTVTQPACAGVRRNVVPWPDGGIYYVGKPGPFFVTINPGDTLVLKASYNTWNYFVLEDIHGTPSCPIVIINEGGQVSMTQGINMKNCSNIKITGSGSSHFYGFHVYNPAANDNAGVAICIQGRSRNIETERVSVRKKTYGAWIKQDPGCIDSLNYPNWKMDNITIHDSKFVNIGQDCIYAGNTDPVGFRTVMCNGVPRNPVPIRLSNIHLYNLIIDSCMRTGIQLSGCDSGYNSIHDNIVTRCGYELNEQQGTGISLGGMTRNTYVYNNTIISTYLYGILSVGVGDNYIENNFIDSTGYLDGIINQVTKPNSIFLDTRQTLPFDSSRIIVKNNRIGINANVNNQDLLVYQSAPAWASGNQVCGNTRLDGITPITYSIPQGWNWTNCLPPVPGNQPPLANAGADKVITLPVNQAMLHGSVMDPDGSIVYNEWKKISGPASFHIQSPNTPQTNVQNLIAGTYSFEYMATDNQGAIGRDTVKVTVNPATPPPINVAPVANAGNAGTITLPANSYVFQGSGSDADGTIVSYHWSRISGPMQVALHPANQATVTASNLVAGVYSFQLMVTDNQGATGKDTVLLTVHAAPPPVNTPPVANAGPNLTITLPTNSAALIGSASDADGHVVQYSWNKVAGPSMFHLDHPGSPATTVIGVVQGVYYFELKVTDNSGATDTDTMVLTVLQAPNILPVANAGPDKSITLPLNSVTLSGSATDHDGSISSYVWTKTSGPSSYTIASPNSAATTITGLVQGTYVFRLTVTDNGGATAWDAVTVIVNAASATNILPVANAGPDRSIIAPASNITVTGTASDADGIISSVSWSRISGPSSSNIDAPSQLQTVIGNLVPGTYKFQLSVTDNRGGVDRDTMTITVITVQNRPPIVNAGQDAEVYLPANSTLLQGTATDPDGTITGWMWRKISGPGQGIVTSPSYSSTDVISIEEGVYEFELKATDNNGASARDTVKVTVIRILPSTARVFPNPTADELFIDIDASTAYNLTRLVIYDANGRPVYEEIFMRTTKRMTKQISIGHLPKGIYFLDVMADINTKVVCKVIRQ
jgi:hypothetical protein